MNMITVLIIMTAFMMASSKRISMLVNAFAAQSAIIAVFVFLEAYSYGSGRLMTIAVLIFLVKALFVPKVIRDIALKIKADGNLGLIVNPMLSTVLGRGAFVPGLVLREKSYRPFRRSAGWALAASISVLLTGLFLMVSRLKAIAQVVGLVVMENGIFLAAAALCGNMPFFVEIAIFFDVFVCVVILGMFVTG